MSLTRRHALTLALTASAGAVMGVPGCGRVQSTADSTPELASPPLARRAAGKGVIFGAASGREALADPKHAKAFAHECAILVPENELKWRALRPTPETFDFRDADWLAQFAKSHNMAFRGHALVWHISNPLWLPEALKSGDPNSIFEKHIRAVAGRYGGTMHSWDVVNEAIDIGDGRADGLANTIWLRTLGPSYIERAFFLAAEADPDALLLYNEFGLDYPDDASTRKRDAVLRLLETLRRRHAPVHALGIQAHLHADEQFDPVIATRFLDEVGGLGLHVFITELDVRDRDLPRNHARRDRAVASVYREYMDTVLAHPAVAAVITWGLSDKYSFRNDPYFKRRFWTARPLPLDHDMRRKPAWAAMATAFDRAQTRMPLSRRDGQLAPIFKSLIGP